MGQTKSIDILSSSSYTNSGVKFPNRKLVVEFGASLELFTRVLWTKLDEEVSRTWMVLWQRGEVKELISSSAVNFFLKTSSN